MRVDSNFVTLQTVLRQASLSAASGFNPADWAGGLILGPDGCPEFFSYPPNAQRVMRNKVYELKVQWKHINKT